MISHRAFATRLQAQRWAAMTRSRALRLAAAFGLAVLIGGLAVPFRPQDPVNKVARRVDESVGCGDLVSPKQVAMRDAVADFDNLTV